MKVPPLAKNYSLLTPEERFRLILAASGRGDVAERAQLGNAGRGITLSNNGEGVGLGRVTQAWNGQKGRS